MNQKSTTTQLIEFYENIYRNADNRIQSDVIYLDISKAFDCVPHDLLIKKLKTFGFNGKLLNWIKNYLEKRKQRVVIEGEHSNFCKVTSGVPQGSILGPMLFLLYINDMSTCVNNSECKLYLYADDSKLVRDIKNQNDCMELQISINNLLRWSNDWCMNFNFTKCCIMSFAKAKSLINYDYYMGNNLLTRVDSMVDLGITVCSNLRWDSHIDNITKRAYQRLGLVKRCIGSSCDMNIKNLCYKSLVRPILESNSCIWSCNTKKLLTKIESVQRRATKFITCSYTQDYKTRLINCDLLPLALRRDFLDSVLFYNHVNDLVFLNLRVKLVNQDFAYLTRNVADHLSLENIRCNTYMYSKQYNVRIIKTWNCIPYEIRNLSLTDSGTNSTFKNKLKVWLKQLFMNNFDVNNTCSWTVSCSCNNCINV